MNREEALRQENALCDLEKNGSISLGRPVSDRKRVEALNHAARPKFAGGSLIVGPEAYLHGFVSPASVQWPAILQGYGTNAGKTEDRGLAS